VRRMLCSGALLIRAHSVGQEWVPGFAEQRKERRTASGTRARGYALAMSGKTASILVFSVAALNGLTI
jgi:hypothetical protein